MVYSREMKQTIIWTSVLALLPALLPLNCNAQQDHLNADEINSALQAPAKKHHTEFIDMRAVIGSEMSNGTGHGSELPSIDVYMPDSWIATQRDFAKKQYRGYVPTGDDTLRALTVVARGIATGTVSGPQCDSVVRLALISDKAGSVVAEAVNHQEVTKEYQNGFGASAACSVVTAKFMLSDLARVESAANRSNFFIGVFYSDGTSKLYEMKLPYRKDLGI